MKIGIIREGKQPADKRTPFTPMQCKRIQNLYPFVEILVQPSSVRCFSDAEYEQEGIRLSEEMETCDILFGIKEVPIAQLIPSKKYLFFSHTHKLQAHNRPLIQAVLSKGITLIDYECLTYPTGERVIGFGRFAGIAGTYQAFLGWGKKFQRYTLKSPETCNSFEEMKQELKKVRLDNIKILLTGNGRVGKGAKEVLDLMGIRKVSVQEYLTKSFDEPVYCNALPQDYNISREGKPWDSQHFFKHGEEYVSDFKKFLPHTDLFIAGHFWDKKAPVFFTKKELASPDFRIKLIADISCDIDGPIPTTLRASTIAEPFYDIDRATCQERPAFTTDLTIMAIDNLPCSMPKDASTDFGNNLIEKVLPALLVEDKEGIIQRATITSQGEFTPKYRYMQSFASTVSV